MQLLLDPEVRQISMGALHQLQNDVKECEGESCSPENVNQLGVELPTFDKLDFAATGRTSKYLLGKFR